ncbi:MAG: M20/M25/M40 family metallo-hydrolase [Oscillospiraceae bacterium]|nr:M20/M25/M40 family metallo-hydrolase [Oscillospiraceae bacterium]
MLDIVSLLKDWQGIGSVSGAEGALGARIAALAAPYADEITTDALGNLIVRQKGDGPRVMLSAHMDAVGLMATHIDEAGFVRCALIGAASRRGLTGAPVRFDSGVLGVVAYDEKVALKDRKAEHFYIDVGAADRAEALTRVAVGDRASYAGGLFEMGGGYVAGPYLDDRLGCAVLLQALSRTRGAPHDLYFVFSVQEEVGCRGARTAAFAIDPAWALAVDVTGAGDVPEALGKGHCRLGGGAAVKLMDGSMIAHPTVVRHLEETAQAEGVRWQSVAASAGGTDAGPIHLSRGGVPSGGVGIPLRYTHSPTEVAALADADAAAALVTAAVGKPLAFR